MYRFLQEIPLAILNMRPLLPGTFGQERVLRSQCGLAAMDWWEILTHVKVLLVAVAESVATQNMS